MKKTLTLFALALTAAPAFAADLLQVYRDAIEYETQRQVQDWLSDENYVFGKAANENRGWNADKQMTEYQRSKEAAHDYRYFPDPDLMPVTTSADWVEKVRGELPEGPTVRRDRLVSEFGLSPGDADLIVADRGDADLFDAAIDGDKTLEGSLAFLVTAFFCIQAPLLLFSPLQSVETLLIALLLSLLLMMVEAVAWRGLDNFFIPIFGFLLLDGAMGMSIGELVGQLVLTVPLAIFTIQVLINITFTVESQR